MKKYWLVYKENAWMKGGFPAIGQTRLIDCLGKGVKR